MIDLLTGGASFLVSAAGGSFIKLISGTLTDLISGWFKTKRENEAARTEREIARQRGDTAAYRQRLTLGSDDPSHYGFVLWTRRLLALSVTWTVCYIAILWAHNPGRTITTFDPDPSGNFSLLWGLVAWPVGAQETVVVSTGAIVWGLLNLMGFILGMYFTPSGKR